MVPKFLFFYSRMLLLLQLPQKLVFVTSNIWEVPKNILLQPQFSSFVPSITLLSLFLFCLVFSTCRSFCFTLRPIQHLVPWPILPLGPPALEKQLVTCSKTYREAVTEPEPTACPYKPSWRALCTTTQSCLSIPRPAQQFTSPWSPNSAWNKDTDPEKLNPNVESFICSFFPNNPIGP